MEKVHGEIETFARKQFMSLRQSIRLQLIFEELVYQMLLNRREKIFPVEMAMMYSDALEKCDVRIVYGGELYNPLEADDVDIISLNLIKGAVEDLHFNFDGKNFLNVTVK